MSGVPGGVLEVLQLRVTRHLETSRAFYVDVLGATIVRETPGMLVFLELAGTPLVLSTAGGPTSDKPTVTFAAPTDPDLVTAELIIRVRDIHAAYRELTARGARFLTPPVQTAWETRCYLRDPDGHLIELTQPPENTAAAPEGAFLS